MRVSQGGPCSLVPFQNCPMFPCSHTLSECFRTVIFRILFPCSQNLANVPLFPSIFCQCSLVPQNPWETLINLLSLLSPDLISRFDSFGVVHFVVTRFINSTFVRKRAHISISPNLQFTVESNPGLHWFCFTSLCDWSRKLAPPS